MNIQFTCVVAFVLILATVAEAKPSCCNYKGVHCYDNGLCKLPSNSGDGKCTEICVLPGSCSFFAKLRCAFVLGKCAAACISTMGASCIICMGSSWLSCHNC